jgi:hypothetical protein
MTSAELSPGETWSFNVTVIPKLFGIYESTRARMRYVSGQADADSEEDMEAATRNAYSSTIGRVKIISAEENAKEKTMESVKMVFLGALILVPALFALFYFNKPSVAKSGASKKDHKSSKSKKH